jgi:signal transduction histidine kinase
MNTEASAPMLQLGSDLAQRVLDPAPGDEGSPDWRWSQENVLSVASIAHELHQPLSAVMLNAQAARRWLRGSAANSRKALARLRAIERDVQRAADILARIRSLVTPISDPASQISTFSINALVHASLRQLKDEFHRTGARLHLSLAANLPQVFADALQIQEVLINLIRNALEAMSTVRGRARNLLISSRLEQHDEILVRVCDSGVGLPHDVLAHMFEPLYSTKTGGMGIGLSLSRQIVMQHGGRLWATCNVPHGATLNLTLPTGRGTARRTHEKPP